MFPIREKNEKGLYAVNLYTLGVPHTIFVDDYIPVNDNSPYGYIPAFAKGATDGSLWPILAEKAFAK